MPLYAVTGNLVAPAAGNGVKIKEGTNARLGVATLVAGTVTVTNASVTSITRVMLSHATLGGTIGVLTSVVVANTSFTITSSNPLDTSTVNWLLVEPA